MEGLLDQFAFALNAELSNWVPNDSHRIFNVFVYVCNVLATDATKYASREAV